MKHYLLKWSVCALCLMGIMIFGASRSENTLVAAEGEMASPRMTAKININTATVDELSQLERVGPTYAQRIIDHREKFGYFKTAESIMKVKGIGRKTYESNKDIIEIFVEDELE